MKIVGKINGRTVREFISYDEYFEWTEQFENCSDYQFLPTIIDDGFKISCDLFTECKTINTVMNRFEKAFGYKKELIEWFEAMRESFESGCYEDIKGCYPTWTTDIKEIQKFLKDGMYSFGIEQTDDNLWYVFLNVSGTYIGREKAT